MTELLIPKPRGETLLATSAGFLVGSLYALAVWVLWEELYPEKLALATLAGFAVNTASGIIIPLVSARMKRPLSLAGVLECVVAQLLSFIVSATVVFEILTSI